MSRQVFTTPSGDRMVIISEDEYERLLDIEQMAADVVAVDDIRKKILAGEEELIPADMVKRMVEGESPIRVWREHRGLSAAALAEMAGITQPFLSQIEGGKREGTVSTLRKIADALRVTIDDLV